MLLIDSGNSAIKCRLIDQSYVIDRVFPVHDDPTLTAFSHFIQEANSAKIVLASVASDNITRKIKDIIRHQSSAVLTQLHTLASLGGLKNGYIDYKQLGVDRWLTLLAARNLFSSDLMIIDGGSAITIDLISRQEGHLGGAILPGFNTSLERFKEILPGIDFDYPHILKNELPGKTTLECIQISSEPTRMRQLNNLLHQWQQLLQRPVTVLLCGQDAPHIQQQLDIDSQIVADLVFKGMLKQIELQG